MINEEIIDESFLCRQVCLLLYKIFLSKKMWKKLKTWNTSRFACFLQSGKNRRLSSIFDSCWKNNFCLGTFGEVVPFCEPNGPDVDINNINSLDNSGSNETMQKVLASIVQLQRSFQKNFGGSQNSKIGTSVFFIRFR